MLWYFERRFIHTKLLESQWRTVEKRREHRNDEWLDLSLHNTSISDVISIIEELFDGSELIDIEED